MAEFLPDP